MRKRARMDSTFIFEFSRGSELPYEKAIVVCTSLTTVLIGATVTHLGIHSMLFHAQASADVDLIHSCCRNPNLAKCEGEAQHLEKLGIWSPRGLPNV